LPPFSAFYTRKNKKDRKERESEKKVRKQKAMNESSVFTLLWRGKLYTKKKQASKQQRTRARRK
jgi:predicted RNase H-like nuclease